MSLISWIGLEIELSKLDMSSSILKLREIINSGVNQDSGTKFLALEDGMHPSLFVTDRGLALEMIRHPDLRPIDFLGFWKDLTGVVDEDIKEIKEYFSRTPIILHQGPHFDARRALLPLYRDVESNISAWLDDFTSDYFSRYAANEEINTISFVDRYLSTFFDRIISELLGTNQEQVPELPGKIFQFLIHLDTILDYESKLHLLREFILSNLEAPDEQVDFIWATISIVVMGTDTLTGALIFAIKNIESLDTAESIFERSRPITLISREAVANFNVGGLDLVRSQRVYISTKLIDGNGKSAAIPFGFGVHLCPGKKISMLIMDSFLSYLQKNPKFGERFSQVKFYRDSVLKAKDVK